MTATNLQHALDKIFGHEGGFSSDHADPGNWTGGAVGVGALHGTKFGIAANTYPALDIKNLTLAQAAEIYDQDYAAKVKFDDLPSGLDYAMLDYAVNSGPARAAMELQRIVGVADDGKIGPMTLAALKGDDPKGLIHDLCNRRLAFLHRLSTWPRYGKGWGNRVEAVRTEALRMAG